MFNVDPEFVQWADSGPCTGHGSQLMESKLCPEFVHIQFLPKMCPIGSQLALGLYYWNPMFVQNLSYWQAIGPGPQLIETKLSPLFVHVQCLSIVQNMSSVCQSLKYCDI